MAGWLQLGKEKGQLAGGRLAGVGAVDQVLLDLQAVVAADGAGRGGDRVGRAHQGAHGGDRLGPLEAQGDQRPRSDEGDQVAEERLALVLAVVPLGGGLVEGAQLHGEEPEALAFQPADHLADQAAGDRVGLAQDQGAFVGHVDPPEGGEGQAGDSTQAGPGPMSRSRASPTVYREPVMTTASDSAAPSMARRTAPATSGATSACRPRASASLRSRSAGAARGLWLVVTISRPVAGARAWRMPRMSLSARQATTRVRRSTTNSSSRAAARARAPAGLWAPSSSTSGWRDTTSRRPGEVTTANPARTVSSSRLRSPRNAWTAASAVAALSAWWRPWSGTSTSRTSPTGVRRS